MEQGVIWVGLYEHLPVLHPPHRREKEVASDFMCIRSNVVVHKLPQQHWELAAKKGGRNAEKVCVLKRYSMKEA